ncbi:hypothetical protein HK096_010468, partial [Nowakowskiella sp. JEL0078]
LRNSALKSVLYANLRLDKYSFQIAEKLMIQGGSSEAEEFTAAVLSASGESLIISTENMLNILTKFSATLNKFASSYLFFNENLSHKVDSELANGAISILRVLDKIFTIDTTSITLKNFSNENTSLATALFDLSEFVPDVAHELLISNPEVDAHKLLEVIKMTSNTTWLSFLKYMKRNSLDEEKIVNVLLREWVAGFSNLNHCGSLSQPVEYLEQIRKLLQISVRNPYLSSQIISTSLSTPKQWHSWISSYTSPLEKQIISSIIDPMIRPILFQYQSLSSTPTCIDQTDHFGLTAFGRVIVFTVGLFKELGPTLFYNSNVNRSWLFAELLRLLVMLRDNTFLTFWKHMRDGTSIINTAMLLNDVEALVVTVSDAFEKNMPVSVFDGHSIEPESLIEATLEGTVRLLNEHGDEYGRPLSLILGIIFRSGNTDVKKWVNFASDVAKKGLKFI